MPLNPKAVSDTARTVDLRVSGHLERNVVQLALMLTVQQVKADRTRFTRNIPPTDPAFPATRLTCVAHGGHVVPHGSDNDVYAALTSLYVEQGMPENGTVTATASRLVTLAGLSDSDNGYRTVEASLKRMRHTEYEIVETWYDGRRGTTVSQNFRLLASVTRVARDAAPEEHRATRAETLLQVQLPDPIAQSIRAGHVRTYNAELHQSLKNVLGRGLYRVLDVIRDPRAPTLTLPLLSWGEYLGYDTLTASKLRSRLNLAHAELQRTGYLREATYGGRGENTTVTYAFHPQLLPPPPVEVVALLTDRGFTLERALVLVTQHGAERILDVVARFEHAKAKGVKILRAPALITSILKTPEQYPLPDKPAALPQVQAQGARPTPVSEPEVPMPERDLKGANALLTKDFLAKEGAAGRALRDRAGALYVDRVIEPADLLHLRSLSLTEASHLVDEWTRRRDP